MDAFRDVSVALLQSTQDGQYLSSSGSDWFGDVIALKVLCTTGLTSFETGWL